MSIEATRKLADERRRMAQLVRDTEHELRTNPAYAPYFAGYTAASVDAFISAYAQRKASYVLQGPGFAQWHERQATQRHTEAYERLWEIQQKKLFDLQCRWRAKEIDLPGVNIYEQFQEWEGHPERCDFLPPITPDEVALYRAYLLSDDCVDAADYYSHWRPTNWQNYADMHLTEESPFDIDTHIYADPEPSLNNEHPGYLPWYAYHDRHHGRDMLALPDLRGERQKHYALLYLKHSHAKQNAKRARDEKKAAAAAKAAALPPPAPAAAPDRRPMWHHYDGDLFEEVVEKFDPTPRLLRLKEATDDGIHHRDDTNDEVSDAFDVLVEAQELVPLEADAADWREALVAAATALNKQWLAEALDVVYEQYCQRLALGLAPAPPAAHEGLSREDYEKHVLANQRKWVLGGRALCQEPLDFDY